MACANYAGGALSSAEIGQAHPQSDTTLFMLARAHPCWRSGAKPWPQATAARASLARVASVVWSQIPSQRLGRPPSARRATNPGRSQLGRSPQAEGCCHASSGERSARRRSTDPSGSPGRYPLGTYGG